MKKLLIATHNPAKFFEIKHFLQDLPLKLISLKEIGIKEDVKEDGKTFEENAIKKARFYAKKSSLPTIADDGGLEIDYLDGEPGVHSRRWINGRRASDEELISYTLELLKNVPAQKRGAQLRAAVALASPEGRLKVVEGKIRGIIAQKPYSKFRWQGFPFRSIFYLPKISKFYNPKEMSREEERKYNHRGKALRKLKSFLQRIILKEDNPQ